MNKEDIYKITSNDFADAIVEYGLPQEYYALFQSSAVNYIDDKYSTIYYPSSLLSDNTFIQKIGYSAVPNLYGLLDTEVLEEIGVRRIQNIPTLSLRGEGVLLGFIDTGIDYTNPIFQYADRTTRISSIWDQSIENLNASSDNFYYGTEYSREQINLALQNESPLSIVPSMDEIGHGTSLAGLAGGAGNINPNFSGIATYAEFVVVKLKEAKANLKEFYLVPKDAISYQENDIMFGISYLFNKAISLKKPIVICIGLGSNQGAHDSSGSLADMIYNYANKLGVAIVVAAGNEVNALHHYYGGTVSTAAYETVELKVGENDTGFSMELWGNIPGTYSISMVSPSGEYISRIPAKRGEHREFTFLFENTTVVIDYFLVEAQTGIQLILFRFMNAAPGIWKINVYKSKISSGYHIWLPMRNFISAETYFISADPYTTITNPANSVTPITITAYNILDQSIYTNASRGYTQTFAIKPDLAAPGVNVYSPTLNNVYEVRTGTSFAAAVTTGTVALLLEWGIVKGNDRIMDGVQVKKYLIRGVKRNPNEEYPNRIWGFGILDIYGTFASRLGES